MDEVEQLKQQIARLQDNLRTLGRPVTDGSCDCCGAVYLPLSHESCRCQSCCWNCRYDWDTRTWIPGSNCPTKKGEN